METRTIEITEEQYQHYLAGKRITVIPPIVNWKPQGGTYKVAELAHSVERLKESGYINDVWLESGRLYKTESEAMLAADAIRAYTRQLAWLSENDDGWYANWAPTNINVKFYVEYDTKTKKYKTTGTRYNNIINIIYMSERNAKKLCELLNSNVVKF